VRNDEASLDDLVALNPSHVVISPGPGEPADAGISVAAIKRFAGMAPILGVCLGHQSIAAAFGANVVRAERLMHGKTSPVYHFGARLYRGLPSPFKATRYHSLTVREGSLPDTLRVTAHTSEGEVMGIEHTELPIFGVQYHPESILTEHGRLLLQNFFNGASS
jgi:anthranilate synthase/aminodeoxychorismate synthase-like glutamine amidotransferase